MTIIGHVLAVKSLDVRCVNLSDSALLYSHNTSKEYKINFQFDCDLSFSEFMLIF